MYKDNSGFKNRFIHFVICIFVILISVFIFNNYINVEDVEYVSDYEVDNNENNETILNNNYNLDYFKNNVNEDYYDVVELNSCIDGDTARFIVNEKEEKVRFLAIDTPETVKYDYEVEDFGIEASDYTKELLENADDIIIEYEKVNDYDIYDRLLAWVFVDGELLQELLVSNGLAEVAYIYDDYKYTDVLYEAEEYAKENKLGLWSK